MLLPLPHRADGFVFEVDGLAVADRTSAEVTAGAPRSPLVSPQLDDFLDSGGGLKRT